MTQTADQDMLARFEAAAAELEARYANEHMEDEDTDAELQAWLDGDTEPLPWTNPAHVTADEWFFISTLYGEMTMEGQRSHIRKYFPTLFVDAAGRDMRNFIPDMPEYVGLRSGWMSRRLAKMGGILRERGIGMEEYAEHLRNLEAQATPDNPTPALDTIIRDHQATGWKTLSVFIRDCVNGNSFPIDSRVEKELNRTGFPVDERRLISMALAIGRNTRRVARLFYKAGGSGE